MKLHLKSEFSLSNFGIINDHDDLIIRPIYSKIFLYI